jgi:LysR family transcriptional regulator, low CO2-responsive transcriptional regulator
MNLNHGDRMEDVQGLKVFVAVAEKLSFTRAAESLFLTQSAVSRQILRMEQSLGTPLLNRIGRTVSLTAAGAVLFQQAGRVFAALADAEAAVRVAGNPEFGRMRIGASATACQFIIPEALREFRESFPSYTLTITPGDSPEILDYLMEDRIDLGVLIRTERQSRLAYHDLFEDELGFIVSPLHPWARKGKVDRHQIQSQRMILYTRNSATFRLIERYLAKLRLPMQDWIELGSMEAIKEMVKLGLGISVVAKWTAKQELNAKSLIWLPLPGTKLKRTWSIAWLATREPAVAEHTFIRLCEHASMRLDGG